MCLSSCFCVRSAAFTKQSQDNNPYLVSPSDHLFIFDLLLVRQVGPLLFCDTFFLFVSRKGVVIISIQYLVRSGFWHALRWVMTHGWFHLNDLTLLPHVCVSSTVATIYRVLVFTEPALDTAAFSRDILLIHLAPKNRTLLSLSENKDRCCLYLLQLNVRRRGYQQGFCVIGWI